MLRLIAAVASLTPVSASAHGAAPRQVRLRARGSQDGKEVPLLHKGRAVRADQSRAQGLVGRVTLLQRRYRLPSNQRPCAASRRPPRAPRRLLPCPRRMRCACDVAAAAAAAAAMCQHDCASGSYPVRLGGPRVHDHQFLEPVPAGSDAATPSKPGRAAPPPPPQVEVAPPPRPVSRGAACLALAPPGLPVCTARHRDPPSPAVHLPCTCGAPCCCLSCGCRPACGCPATPCTGCGWDPSPRYYACIPCLLGRGEGCDLCSSSRHSGQPRPPADGASIAFPCPASVAGTLVAAAPPSSAPPSRSATSDLKPPAHGCNGVVLGSI